MSPTPFMDLALKLDIPEDILIEKIQDFSQRGILTRVGPFYNMDKSTGTVSLVAMIVPDDRFEEVTSIVNSFEEVAHNYCREHKFNMWFVIAAKSPDLAVELLQKIEAQTNLKTFNFPKEKEFALDLFLEVE